MDDRDFEIIEQYLGNELSASDRQAFDRRLKSDETLAREFGRRRTAHRALDFMIAQNLKQQLAALEKEESKIIPLHARRRKMIYILSAAASVLLLIATFAILVPGKSSPAELAAVYYEQPDFSTQRSAGVPAGQTNNFSSGIAALETGDYHQAVDLLGSIPETDENYILARYYQAHAYYLLQQYNEAETDFSLVSESNDIRYRDQAEWYELLACLSQEKDCRSLLEQIISDATHAHYQEAAKIERRLK